ncbi:hypothetical protein B0H11DRAFT_2372897 [Mycena galericulata]|nr:hypothetical protein B0H11DRAFT_2372897 [Mycena galericulata]
MLDTRRSRAPSHPAHMDFYPAQRQRIDLLSSHLLILTSSTQQPSNSPARHLFSCAQIGSTSVIALGHPAAHKVKLSINTPKRSLVLARAIAVSSVSTAVRTAPLLRGAHRSTRTALRGRRSGTRCAQDVHRPASVATSPPSRAPSSLSLNSAYFVAASKVAIRRLPADARLAQLPLSPPPLPCAHPRHRNRPRPPLHPLLIVIRGTDIGYSAIVLPPTPKIQTRHPLPTILVACPSSACALPDARRRRMLGTAAGGAESSSSSRRPGFTLHLVGIRVDRLDWIQGAGALGVGRRRALIAGAVSTPPIPGSAASLLRPTLLDAAARVHLVPHPPPSRTPSMHRIRICSRPPPSPVACFCFRIHPPLVTFGSPCASASSAPSACSSPPPYSPPRTCVVQTGVGRRGRGRGGAGGGENAGAEGGGSADAESSRHPPPVPVLDLVGIRVELIQDARGSEVATRSSRRVSAPAPAFLRPRPIPFRRCTPRVHLVPGRSGAGGGGRCGRAGGDAGLDYEGSLAPGAGEWGAKLSASSSRSRCPDAHS